METNVTKIDRLFRARWFQYALRTVIAVVFVYGMWCSWRLSSDRTEIEFEIRAKTHFEQGCAHHAKGDLDMAIVEYSKAIQLCPGIATAYFNRGHAYMGEEAIDKALADFTAAIRLDSKDGEAYFSRGVVYEKKGEKSKAEQDFAEATKLGYKPR